MLDRKGQTARGFFPFRLTGEGTWSLPRHCASRWRAPGGWSWQPVSNRHKSVPRHHARREDGPCGRPLRLRPSEKLAFLQLATHVIHSDGEKAEAEAQLFDAMSHEMQFAFEPEELTADFTEAAAVFQSPTSRRIALLELLSLANADQDFAHAERGQIDHLAELYGISRGDVAHLEGWVQRMMNVAAEGERLLG